MTQPTTLILLLALTTAQALGQTPSGVKGGQGVSADFFTQKILPVLQQKCFNCHQTGRKMKGGLAVDSQAALIAGGDSGPALVPGDAAKSLLYVSMTYADPDLQMPPRERLSASVLADFKKWIELGAPFGAGSPPVAGGATVTPAAEGAGFFATLTAVRGSSVTYTRDDAGGGVMRGGIGKGKGKAKGGAMRSGGGETTQKVVEKALITTATLARRTQDLLVGIELSGGLSNPAFDVVRQGGARAHLVVKDGQITELNLITAQEESDAPIAVKPKRPPSRAATFTP
jgi:Planctomycete cytochrome C